MPSFDLIMLDCILVVKIDSSEDYFLEFHWDAPNFLQFLFELEDSFFGLGLNHPFLALKVDPDVNIYLPVRHFLGTLDMDYCLFVNA